ncbi:hypothetical protein [Xanthomonas fragariae]|nr:hypothetical protein [Xanthomonas fragariae]WAT14129.1 hypothetical protein OZ429_13715 [Xanthomonas fragariae]
MPIIGIVRLRGGRFNWATPVASFTALPHCARHMARRRSGQGNAA